MNPRQADALATVSAEKIVAEINRIHVEHGDAVALHVIRGFLGGCAGYVRHCWSPEIAFAMVQDVADLAARSITPVEINLPPKE